MDKIAIISDIHGNIPALDAVLEDIKGRDINKIICLGDIAGKGPSSAEAVDLIKEHCEHVIKGNWDFFMTEQESEMLNWHQEKLGEERLNFLKELPIYVEFYISGRLIRLCHASPNDLFHRTYLRSNMEDRLKLFEPTITLDKPADVIGYGDIHGSHVDNFDGKTIFNTGSVGNPLDITQASYAIIEGVYESLEVAPFTVSIVRIPYNIEQAVAEAMSTDMPDKEAYIRELRTGVYRGKFNKKLSESAMEAVDKYINSEARPLEKALYNYYFVSSDSEHVLDALETYQNEDGGFGKGLEPDFKLPNSSPMATSIGLRYLSIIDKSDRSQGMIKKAIKYLERTFDGSRNGWQSVPKEVNDYPHAPWWHYNKDTNKTIIDHSWGNPTAELIGYIYKYQDYLTTFDVHSLISYAIGKLNDQKEYTSAHEIYCYIRMYNMVPKDYADQMVEPLKVAISQLINVDQNDWDNYVPTPLSFITYDSNYYFGINGKLISANLEYLIDKIENKGALHPSWQWDNYLEQWEIAKNEWAGIINLETLLTLYKFKRLK